MPRSSRRRTPPRGLFLLAVATLLVLAPAATAGVTLETNEAFIEGLQSALDVTDADAVFATVFSRLDDRVEIYPTENYYYFKLNVAGETLAGNLRLGANDRDLGVVHFGYFRYDDNGQFQDRKGWARRYTAQDGVTVAKVAELTYAVTYAGKRVVFVLNAPPFAPPAHAVLRDEETYVGPIFDESGLRFALLFDETNDHFFYLLDEDGTVPETFVPVADHVVVGRRTGFAFYVDEPRHRKVLIAIHTAGVSRNSYYDGPFDQLPDNHVERSHIRKLLERAYPHSLGNVDHFGFYKDNPDARVAIMAYHVYTHTGDLSYVDSCTSLYRDDASHFLACITPDYRQRLENQPQLVGIGGVTVKGRVGDAPAAPASAPPSAAAAPGGSGSAP